MEDDSDRPGTPVPKSPIPRPRGSSDQLPDEPDPSGGSEIPSDPVSPIDCDHTPVEEKDVIGQEIRNTPFHKHSLNGDGAKLKANAVDTKPLFGDHVKLGQATMIYAESNSGKTLSTIANIREAIELRRIDPHSIIYINADDSSKGLAEKVEILEEIGVHMLAPNYKGFKASQFVDKLNQGIEDGSARGSVVIIDTLKKFTNLMDKGKSSEFAQVCRDYVMAGGTIVALGHTAKSPNPDGTPRYQGTTDILEDFDSVYVAQPMSGKAGSRERIIRFTRIKSRAESPEVVAYAYSTESGLSYADKVASVRLMYPEELDGSSLELDQLNDDEVIKAIRAYLQCGHGHVGKDKMIRALARDGDISRSTAERILDRYTGPDPARHYWDFDKGDRGKRTYYLLTPAV